MKTKIELYALHEIKQDTFIITKKSNLGGGGEIHEFINLYKEDRKKTDILIMGILYAMNEKLKERVYTAMAMQGLRNGTTTPQEGEEYLQKPPLLWVMPKITIKEFYERYKIILDRDEFSGKDRSTHIELKSNAVVKPHTPETIKLIPHQV